MTMRAHSVTPVVLGVPTRGRLTPDSAEGHSVVSGMALSRKGQGAGWPGEDQRRACRGCGTSMHPDGHACLPNLDQHRASSGQASKVLVLPRSVSGGRPYQSLTGLDVQAEHRLHGEGHLRHWLMTSVPRGLAYSGWTPGAVHSTGAYLGGVSDVSTSVLGNPQVEGKARELATEARQLGGPGAGAPGVSEMSTRGARTTEGRQQ